MIIIILYAKKTTVVSENLDTDLKIILLDALDRINILFISLPFWT